MTVMCFFLSLLGSGIPIIMWLIAMLCDTAILITAMSMGIIHV